MRDIIKMPVILAIFTIVTLFAGAPRAAAYTTSDIGTLTPPNETFVQVISLKQLEKIFAEKGLPLEKAKDVWEQHGQPVMPLGSTMWALSCPDSFAAGVFFDTGWGNFSRQFKGTAYNTTVTYGWCPELNGCAWWHDVDGIAGNRWMSHQITYDLWGSYRWGYCR